MDRQTWERTAALFERALDIPADQRAAFVRSEAADDTALADAVLSMLQQDTATNLLDQSVDTLAARLIDDSDADGQDLAAGTRVGDYQILGVLGRGGMGVVYRARDTRLDRLAALKFIPTSHLSDAAARRMEAEARAASALDHPNIATIYHVGTAADGRPFIAMAHYDGETLAQRLERGALEPKEALRIASAIAAGLEAAHERDILHRDIKPSNVVLTANGGVKLLDFGIAAMAGEFIAGATSGTRAYMSPEQMESAEPQPTSDVWSLGAVLHEMLTGQPPFGPTQRLESIGTPELDAVLRTALARAPSDRYQEIAAMRAEVEHARSKLAAPEPGARRWSRARTVVFAGSAALLAAVLITLAPRVRRASEAPARSVVAVFPFEVRGDSSYAYLREGMVDLLSADFDGIGGLRSVDPRVLRAGLKAAPSAVRDPRSAAALAADLGAGRLILGTIVVTGHQLRAAASLYNVQGQLEATAQAEVLDEERIFELVDQLAGRLLTQQDSSGSELRRLAASTTSSLPALKAYLEGEQAARSGRFEAAANAFDRAVALDTSFALANYGLAVAQWWLDRSELVRIPAARALRQAERLPRAAKLQLEGTLARLEGDLDRAERIYRQATLLSPRDVESWYGLGDVIHHYNPVRGRPLSEAVPYFERALRLQPDNMSVRLHLANIAARHRNYPRHDSLIANLPTNARFARFTRLVHAFAGNDTAAQYRVSREFREADDNILAEAIHYIVRLAHNPAGGLRFLATVEQPGKDRRSVAYAHYLRGGLLLDMGRWQAARRELELADAMGNGSALPTLALWSLAPFLPADTTKWRAWRARLEQRERDEPARTGSYDRSTFAYLRGLLSVRLGDTASALRTADSLEARGATAHSRNGALSIRAELARQRGQHATALALLEQLSPQTTLSPVQDPPLANSYERFMRAELLRTVGRVDEAIGWYRGQMEASMVEAIYVAPAYMRSAQLLAARRDTAARAHERWYGYLWSDADPGVRAWR